MKPMVIVLVMVFAVLFPAVSGATAQWSAVPDPVQIDDIQVFAAGSPALFAGTLLGQVYSSGDHGSTWAQVGGDLPGDYAPVEALAQAGDWLLMGRSISGPFNFRSHYDGSQWSPWEALSYQAAPIRSFSVIEDNVIGDVVFALYSDGSIHRSDDHGATWTATSAPGGSATGKLFMHEGRLFASQHLINSGQIYRSDDLGQTWVAIGNGLGSSYICSHAYWHGQLLVCVYNMAGIGTVWTSSDFGGSWQRVQTLPTNRNINGMALSQDGRLAIGASGTSANNESIWLTADLLQWEGFTGNLPEFARPVNDLVSHDGWFFKTGGSVTAYRAQHPSTTGVSTGGATASMLSLVVRPNPARIGATVRFDLPRAAEVDLGVFDLAGRRVATLAHGLTNAGAHEPNWQAQDEAGRSLPAGVYFARIRAGQESSALKIVLQP